MVIVIIVIVALLISLAAVILACTLSQRGPRGDQGCTGVTGSGGTNGETGLIGAQGATGAAGATGASLNPFIPFAMGPMGSFGVSVSTDTGGGIALAFGGCNGAGNTVLGSPEMGFDAMESMAFSVPRDTTFQNLSVRIVVDSAGLTGTVRVALWTSPCDVVDFQETALIAEQTLSAVSGPVTYCFFNDVDTTLLPAGDIAVLWISTVENITVTMLRCSGSVGYV
jgi:hypothetical protein